MSLIKHIDGQVVTNELDKILEEMIKDEDIFNGDILILDYVEIISNEPKIECPMECPTESSAETSMVKNLPTKSGSKNSQKAENGS